MEEKETKRKGKRIPDYFYPEREEKKRMKREKETKKREKAKKASAREGVKQKNLQARPDFEERKGEHLQNEEKVENGNYSLATLSIGQ